MGGASTQIAFNPTGNVLADKFPVRIGHEMYSLYVHSYLDYGQNRIVQRIRKILARESGGASEINNPCMMTGNISRLCSARESIAEVNIFCKKRKSTDELNYGFCSLLLSYLLCSCSSL